MQYTNPRHRLALVSAVRLLIALTGATALVGGQSAPKPDYPSLVKSAESGVPPDWDGSVRTSPSIVSPNVENGDAFDVAILNVPAWVTKIEIPVSCRVVSSPDQSITLLLKKSLHWAGHTDKSTSIRTERLKMGCCMKIEGTKMCLGLFGDWSSFEGGSGIEMALVVPPRLAVTKRKALHFTDHPYESGYGASPPPADWFVIPTLPDGGKRFERHVAKTQ